MILLAATIVGRYMFRLAGACRRRSPVRDGNFLVDVVIDDLVVLLGLRGRAHGVEGIVVVGPRRPNGLVAHGSPPSWFVAMRPGKRMHLVRRHTSRRVAR
jgi:hypothetical protein